jgi:hypothetical protein
MGKRIFAIAMVLAMLVVMAVPVGVGAGTDTDTTAVSGYVGSNYTITAPDDIALGDFIAATTYACTGKTVSVSTTGTSTTVDITVQGSHDGYLSLNGAGVTALTNELQVSGGEQVGLVDLTTSATDLVTDGALSGNAYSFNDFIASQTIVAGDLSKTAGSYSITLTFTATFN